MLRCVLTKAEAAKYKDKGHPRTGHEGPEGEQNGGTLDEDGWSTPRPARERPGTHCI